jgi:hypothetical protein
MSARLHGGEGERCRMSARLLGGEAEVSQERLEGEIGVVSCR